jgi:hypothetical protein
MAAQESPVIHLRFECAAADYSRHCHPERRHRSETQMSKSRDPPTFHLDNPSHKPLDINPGVDHDFATGLRVRPSHYPALRTGLLPARFQRSDPGILHGGAGKTGHSYRVYVRRR